MGKIEYKFTNSTDVDPDKLDSNGDPNDFYYSSVETWIDLKQAEIREKMGLLDQKKSWYEKMHDWFASKYKKKQRFKIKL